MIFLPDQQILVRHVCDALHEVAASVPRGAETPSDGWTNAIGEALYQRLDNTELGIECAFGHRDSLGQKKRESAKEWLFDFVALLVEPADRNQVRSTMQPLVVGEVEWHNNLLADFEKLMVVDALVCFFAFPKRLEIEHNVDYFLSLAEQRRKYVASRGTTPLPVFIIACYDLDSRRFDLRVTE